MSGIRIEPSTAAFRKIISASTTHARGLTAAHCGIAKPHAMLGSPATENEDMAEHRSRRADPDPRRPHLRSRRRRAPAGGGGPSGVRGAHRADRAAHRRAARRRSHRCHQQARRPGLRQCALSFARRADEGPVRGAAVRHLDQLHRRLRLWPALAPRNPHPHADRRGRDAAQRHHHGAGLPHRLSGRRRLCRHRARGL